MYNKYIIIYFNDLFHFFSLQMYPKVPHEYTRLYPKILDCTTHVLGLGTFGYFQMANKPKCTRMYSGTSVVLYHKCTIVPLSYILLWDTLCFYINTRIRLGWGVTIFQISQKNLSLFGPLQRQNLFRIKIVPGPSTPLPLPPQEKL